jgi:hypothetical protein
MENQTEKPSKMKTKSDLRKYWKLFVDESHDLQGTYLYHFFNWRNGQFSLKNLLTIQQSWIDAGKRTQDLIPLIEKLRENASLISLNKDRNYDIFRRKLLCRISGTPSANPVMTQRLLRFEMEFVLSTFGLKSNFEVSRDLLEIDYESLEKYFVKTQHLIDWRSLHAKLKFDTNRIYQTEISSFIKCAMVRLCDKHIYMTEKSVKINHTQTRHDETSHEFEVWDAKKRKIEGDCNMSCGAEPLNVSHINTNQPFSLNHQVGNRLSSSLCATKNGSWEIGCDTQFTRHLEIPSMPSVPSIPIHDEHLLYKLGLIVLHNTFITQIHPTITRDEFNMSFQNIEKTTGTAKRPSDMTLFNLLEDYELQGLIQIEREHAHNFMHIVENRKHQNDKKANLMMHEGTLIKIICTALTIKKELLSNKDDEAKFAKFLLETFDVESKKDELWIIPEKNLNAPRKDIVLETYTSSCEKECDTQKSRNMWAELAMKIDRLENANKLKDQQIAKLEKNLRDIDIKKTKKYEGLNDFGTNDLPPNNEETNIKEPLTIQKKDFPLSLSLLEKLGLVVLHSAFSRKMTSPAPQTTYRAFYNDLNQLHLMTDELFTHQMLQTAVQDNLLLTLETQLFVQMHVKGKNGAPLDKGNPKRNKHLKDPMTKVTIVITQEDIISMLCCKETGGDYFVNLLDLGIGEDLSGETLSLTSNNISKFSSRLRPFLKKIESPTTNELILLLALIKKILPLQFRHNSSDLFNALQVMVNVLIDHVIHSIIRSQNDDISSPSGFWNLLIQLFRVYSSEIRKPLDDSQDQLQGPQEIFDRITTEIYGDNNNQNAQTEVTPNQIFSIAMKQHPKLQTPFHYYPASTLGNSTFMNKESWKYSKQVYLKKNIKQIKGDDGYFLSDFTLVGPSITDDQLITHEDGRDAPQLLYVTSFEWNDDLRSKGAAYKGKRKPVVNWAKSWGDNYCILSAPAVDNLKPLSYRLVSLILLLKNKPHVHRGSLLVNSQEYHQYCLITKRGGDWYYCHNEKRVTACFGNHLDNAFLPGNQHNYTVSEYSHETHAAIFEKITY